MLWLWVAALSAHLIAFNALLMEMSRPRSRSGLICGARDISAIIYAAMLQLGSEASAGATRCLGFAWCILQLPFKSLRLPKNQMKARKCERVRRSSLSKATIRRLSARLGVTIIGDFTTSSQR